MGIFNSDGTQDYPVTVHLDAPINPDRRLRFFEEPLHAAFESEFPGSRIEEGRTLVDADDRPVSADLELVVALDPDRFDEELQRLVDLLDRLGAPRGSWLAVGPLEEADEYEVGRAEGIVVTLPQPEPGAESGTLQEVAELLRPALASDERVLGIDEFGGETRIHLYGPDAHALAERVGAALDAASLPGVSVVPLVTDDEGQWLTVEVQE